MNFSPSRHQSEDKSVPHSSQSHRDPGSPVSVLGSLGWGEWVRRGVFLTVAILLTASAVAIYQAAAPRSAAPSMAALLPQGALLTIQSPDFAALLHQWNASPEQKSWLASDNYSVFSNSRLFGRLNDARAEFEAAATSPSNANPSIDGDFLTQVAGKQSIFAWYDVGNLEFLYITRISSAQSRNIALLKDRAHWTARQSGGMTFYLRKSTDGPAAAAEEQAQSAQGKARTVAFAQVPDPGGDLLLLATREDLIANALALVHPAANAASLATEPWYAEAAAASPRGTVAPELHMVLNLQRLVPLPAFRTYWIQRNVTQMNQYRTAVSDLYLEKSQFREERALLLNAPDDTADQIDLATLASLAPNAGVFRATAPHDSEAAVDALSDKLLGRIAFTPVAETSAPDPTLEVAQSGSTSDLETRIDTPAPVSQTASNRALADTLNAAGLEAMLTYSTAQAPATAAQLWVPIRSAVVLQATSPWNPQTFQSALQQSLRGNLTAANLGIEFRADTSAGQTIYALTGPKPLYFATSGKLCLVSDDRDVLLALLRNAARPALPAPPATLIAGFNHTSQRAPFARLSALVDGTNLRPTQPDTTGTNVTATPTFFSGNLRSLSDSLAALTSEHITERRDGSTLRQTVTYRWQ